jgi:hypothetical protein
MQSDALVLDAQLSDGFNEKLIKLMCLNQAMDKMQREFNTLSTTRD